jgi:hypothetical protein
MPNIKRLTDLTSYKSVLPYDSELFGVYQPLIGWKSKRRMDRIKIAIGLEQSTLISRLRLYFESRAVVNFNADCAISVPDLRPARFAGPDLIPQDSIVLQQISQRLAGRGPLANMDQWNAAINSDTLGAALKAVLEYYNQVSVEGCRRLAQLPPVHETQESFQQRQAALREQVHASVREGISNEAAFAGS